MTLLNNALMIRAVLDEGRAPKRDVAQETRRRSAQGRLQRAATSTARGTLRWMDVSPAGLTEQDVTRARDAHGANMVARQAAPSVADRVFTALSDPFMLILIGLGVASAVTDIVLPAPEDRSYMTVAVIACLLVVSVVVRVVQEGKGAGAAEALASQLSTTAQVKRAGAPARRVDAADVVVGDLVRLEPGDVVCADLRVLRSDGLFVSQASLTGESEPVPKTPAPWRGDGAPDLLDCGCIALSGTDVVSGSGLGVVLAVGDDTMLGQIAESLGEERGPSAFDRGLQKVSRVFVLFTLVMAPLVLLLNGLNKGDWLAAFLFAVTVAVGLIPEMLPTVVTCDLALGAQAMAKKRVVVKELQQIQSLGAMDVLCCDKTGTLTEDRSELERWEGLAGEQSERVLRLAALNAGLQKGAPNAVDRAVLEVWGPRELGAVALAEVPFDFERRCQSVVVDETGGLLVCKGAAEEVLSRCDGLSEEERAAVLARVHEMNEGGLRVLAVGTRPWQGEQPTPDDEQGLTFEGLLGLADPPKPGCPEALDQLRELGVSVKVLTGDNEACAAAVCGRVGIDTSHVVLGSQIEAMDEDQLAEAVEQGHVFAKLAPRHKERIVAALQAGGHTVGFLGDGINDAPALRAADVGVSVDTGTEVARTAAGVVLLEKDLGVLADGVTAGRTVHGNVMKYIKITAASNFGNIGSVTAASILLPFLPMEAVQLVLMNLVWDLSCTGLSADRVDEAWLARPQQWDAASIPRFMVAMGPVSSVFDLLTFAALWFWVCPLAAGGAWGALAPAAAALFVAVFQAGWMIESIWTQALTIRVLRTEQNSWRAHPAPLVTGLTCGGAAGITVLACSPAGAALGLAAPPLAFAGVLVALVAGYGLALTGAKRLYVARHGALL